MPLIFRNVEIRCKSFAPRYRKSCLAFQWQLQKNSRRLNLVTTSTLQDQEEKELQAS